MDFIKKSKSIEYATDFICLDTETSHIDEVAWINSIQVLFQDKYYHFRKPTELCNFLLDIREQYQLNESRMIVVYVHNLSYDLEYLYQWLNKYLLKPQTEHDDLYTGTHKPLFSRFVGFEFRCSYRLSGKSLDKWSKDLNTDHKKAIGTYDYNKVIYQDTELTQTEIDYDMLDVVVLNECLNKQFALYDDTVASVPYTSTGYVRRDVRRTYQENKKNYYKFRDRKISVDCYKAISDLKNGAITHGNRYLREQTLTDIKGKHVDLVSAYPSVCCCYFYPVGKWFRRFDLKTIDDILAKSKYFCMMIRIVIKDAWLHKEVTLPFMQSYKCAIGKYKGFSCVEDNGRILATHGKCEIVVSELMLEILNEQYDFEYIIKEVWLSRKGELPYYIIDNTKHYFYKKTELKEVTKQYEKAFGENDERTQEKKIELLLVKSNLNGIYGMLFEDVVKNIFNYDVYLNEFVKTDIKNNDDEIQNSLNKHYNNRNRFNEMQFGYYTTELVKYQIYQAVKKIGYENFIYCDTDSIFYIETEENKNAIEEINKEMREQAEKFNGYIEYDNNKVWFNMFDFEEDFRTFKFLHSKCYALITERNEFVSTIAGIPKDNKLPQKDINYCSREMELCDCETYKDFKNLKDFSKAFQNFKDGFTFRRCGSTISKYVDCVPHNEIINGHMTEVANSCIIEKSEKKLMSLSEMTLEDFIKEITDNERKR